MFAWPQSGTGVWILENMSKEDFEKFDREEEPETTEDMTWKKRRVEKFQRHGAVFYSHWAQHPLSLKVMTGGKIQPHRLQAQQVLHHPNQAQR